MSQAGPISDRHKRASNTQGTRLASSGKPPTTSVTFTLTLACATLIMAGRVVGSNSTSTPLVTETAPCAPQEPSRAPPEFGDFLENKQQPVPIFARRRPAQAQATNDTTARTARHREPRIYQVRVEGANGDFAGATLRRLDSHPPASERLTDASEAATFPARSPGDFFQAANVTGGSLMHRERQRPKIRRKCARPRLGGSPTGPEDSSVSATSQTLRLVPRPATTTSQALSGDRPTAQQRAIGAEVDELAVRAGQQVGPGERSQSISAAPADPASPTTTEATPDVLRQQSAQSGQKQANTSTLASLIDEIDPRMVTNKAQATLNCDSGEIIVQLNFSQPFKGIVYPNYDRLSPCRFFGDGHLNYELRLPLDGCGTREVAPRVFANDVTVRLHKTLELQEDVVKTLICQYPPPLDITGMLSPPGWPPAGRNNGQQAAGNGLVHEQRPHQSISASRRPGEALRPPNQIEFAVEQTTSGGSLAGGPSPSGRFGQKGSNGASQLEVLEEPGAPPGGGRQNQQQPNPSIGDLINLSPAERILMRQHAIATTTTHQNDAMNEHLLLAPSGGDSPTGKQRLNSRLLLAPNGTGASTSVSPGGANSQRGGGNLSNQLTSIELLFLISSLMFLVLLLISLVSSYFYFDSNGRRQRRRQARLSAAAAAAAAAVHSQTGGGGGGGGGASASRSGTANLLSRKRRYFNSPTSPFALPFGGTGSRIGPTGSRYQTVGGGHLMGGTSSHYNLTGQMPVPYYHQCLQTQQQRQQNQNQSQDYNQSLSSSPGESDVSGQILLPAGSGQVSTGRRAHGNHHLAHYHHHGLHEPPMVTAAAHQQVVGRRQQAHEPPPQQGSLRMMSFQRGGASARSRQMVPAEGASNLGRRASRLGSGNLAATCGLAPAHHGTAPGRTTRHGHTLDKLAARNEAVAQIYHARSLRQLRDEDRATGGPGAAVNMFGPKHAIGANWQRHHPYQQTAGLHQSQRPPTAGEGHLRSSSSPADQHLNDHKIKLKQQQHFYDTSALARPALVAQPAGHDGAMGRQQVAGREQPPGESSSELDERSTCSSELGGVAQPASEPNNNNSEGRTPKLILKSIEDSFVTNFIEIYEQEYKQRDSGGPMSLAEWRRASGQDAQPGQSPPGSAGGDSSGGDSSTLEANREPGEADGKAEGNPPKRSKRSASQTNLRSLTELDVDFAKSMLRPDLASLRLAASELEAGEAAAGKPEGASQVAGRLVREARDELERRSRTEQKRDQNSRATGAGSPTDGLVISPEYSLADKRLGRASRGRDGGPADEERKSWASCESISYA